ncbi:MAG: tRNA (adenine(22)-N(1))-methyltransferase [Pseudomonas sp.]
MRLSKRLTQIDAMVAPGYDHIWDCCCDHGLLGAALLTRQAAPNIHFVDIVPALMQELENKLRRFYSDSAGNWHTHCLDIAALPLAHYPGKHLVIIAGVGGDLMRRFIKTICQAHPALQLDFLLCPVHQEYALRQQLIQLNFSLGYEALISDNGRFYEVLWVRSGHPKASQHPISPAGDLIWQTQTAEQARIAQAYLNKTLVHYQKLLRNQGMEVQQIIDAYHSAGLALTAPQP